MKHRTKKRQLKKRMVTRKYKLIGGSHNIKYYNWWINQRGYEEPTEQEANYFKELLRGCDNFKEIRVYSIFPLIKRRRYVPSSDNILTVQYSAEIDYSDPSMFDINIIPGDNSNIRNSIVSPYMQACLWGENSDLSEFTRVRRTGRSGKKFCLFSVSSETKERTHFFHALSKYKKIDSCGSVLNNLGYYCPGTYDSKEYHDFVGNYKFMICFENTSMPNYITEKLMIAYKHGTIPIYWGCPNLGDYVNMDAILHLKPDYTKYDVEKLMNAWGFELDKEKTDAFLRQSYSY